MAGGDAFFEEGIHWLHIAGSLGPRIATIEGFRPPASTGGPDRRAKSMLVAFQYDNGRRRRAVLLARDPVALQGPAVLEAVRPPRRDHLRVERRDRRGARPGAAAGRRCPAACATFAATARCTAISSARSRKGVQPEMSLERALEDHRLMEQVYASVAARQARTAGDAGARRRRVPPARSPASPMRTERFDVLIIGSGAGGGTIAHALAGTTARILIVERGGFVPQEPENTDPAAVWKDLRYRATETWLDADGQEFLPYTHYNVGGNTKFWGSVLYRLRRAGLRRAPARRRRVAGLADRLRHARAVLRSGRAALPRARRAGRGPDRPAARPVPLRRDSSRGPDVGHRRRAARPRAAPVAAAARRDPARRRPAAASSATPATRSRAGSTRRARPTCAACARRWRGRTSRCGPTRAPAAS